MGLSTAGEAAIEASVSGSSPELTARLLLVPAFGFAVAACFLTSWVVLGRAVTPRVMLAAGFVAAAGSGAALLAVIANHLLRGRPWTARFAAAFVVLSAGTVGLTSLFLGMERAWATHPMAELPLHAALVVVASLGAAALYNVLALAGFLLLPLGLPAILCFAAMLARHRA